MLTIGLTGPTGAGKSTVAELFASFGLPVINADRVWRELLIPPSDCLAELARRFGREIIAPDGTLDRRKLGQAVFSNPAELEALNAISHRHIMSDVARRLRGLRESGCRAAVFDAPQLFEAGADQLCNVIVSVLASAEVRLGRVTRRDGISDHDARMRMAAQKPESFFRAHSDYVIENNGGTEALTAAVRRILSETGVLTQ